MNASLQDAIAKIREGRTPALKDAIDSNPGLADALVRAIIKFDYVKAVEQEIREQTTHTIHCTKCEIKAWWSKHDQRWYHEYPPPFIHVPSLSDKDRLWAEAVIGHKAAAPTH